MRVKGHLAARGVEFDAIDITTDHAALGDLRRHGVRGLPVVGVGDRYILGLDLAQVDELLGLSPAPARALPGDELVDRAIRLLAAASRYARQLPQSRYDTPFPGMENVKPPFALAGGHVLAYPNGVPYVPHGTYLGLYRHIIAHGAHFQRFVEAPDADYTSLGHYSQYGEATPDVTLDELERIAAATSNAIGAWWQRASEADLARVLDTYVGRQTLQQMLQRELYSLAQHTRQLMHILLLLGIEPDGPIGAREYDGLNVPEGVWE